MKKIIRLLTLALLTVPVTTFAQTEVIQNTSEPAAQVFRLVLMCCDCLHAERMS